MLTKELLRQKFAQEAKQHYQVELFRNEGFSRYVCPDCSKGYWSRTERANCGDPSHEPYGFFKEKPLRVDYCKFWDKFADFWKKNGHAVIPRYPVISRWRDDLYFTIASIVDFQRLENGKTVFEYNDNPLVVPQMCLRFNDIANVGVTGRHLSCFMMAGQHAFNCDKEAYWKDKCVQLDYNYLTQVLGVDKNEVVFGEDVWSLPDFSSFGPCIEAYSKGCELVNSVFTEFRAAGPTGDDIQPLEMKVIDVGWGFERLLWYYSGATSVYDAVFPTELELLHKNSPMQMDKELFAKYSRLAASLDVETVRNLKEEKQKIAKGLGISLEQMEKTIAPLQASYAIADHSRTLLFALADGAIPSNTAGGYNIRLLARRCFNFLNEYSFNVDLMDLIALEARLLKPLFPELEESLEDVKGILYEEKRKHAESREKARRLATTVIAKGKPLTTNEMATLYESQGVTPELLEEAARAENKSVEIPSDFYKLITEKHAMEHKTAKKLPIEFEALPATVKLYYQDDSLREAEATVLAVSGNKVVLDRTVLYPEGGGQMYDLGELGGRRIIEVQQIAGKVIHTLENASGLQAGMKVKLVVNWQRREAIVKHHTATHLIIQSAKRVLGNHVWQSGSKKDEDQAHVDLTHYRKLSQEEINSIEALANKKILEQVEVSAREKDRGEAEKKHGFRLYQGGGAIGKKIRVVEIDGFDVQACGGLHLHNTGQEGFIKIIGSEQVQDGIVRLHYVAGTKALEWVQKREKQFTDAARELGVQPDLLSKAVANIFNDWKARGKQLEKLEEELSGQMAANLSSKALSSGSKKVDEKNLQLSQKMLERLALKIAENTSLCAVVSNSEGDVVCACGKENASNAIELLKARGARGGGNEKFARGKI